MSINLLDFGQKNLTAQDIVKDTLTVIVDSAVIKTYDATNDKGKAYQKKVPALKIHYQDGKITQYKDFTLNRENRNRIMTAGVTDLDQLQNASLVLTKEMVDFANKQVMGIRIKSVKLPTE